MCAGDPEPRCAKEHREALLGGVLRALASLLGVASTETLGEARR